MKLWVVPKSSLNESPVRHPVRPFEGSNRLLGVKVKVREGSRKLEKESPEKVGPQGLR